MCKSIVGFFKACIFMICAYPLSRMGYCVVTRREYNACTDLLDTGERVLEQLETSEYVRGSTIAMLDSALIRLSIEREEL